MMELLITTLRLLKAVWRGIRNDPEFRSLMVLFIATLAGGCIFYSSIEGWSVLDSLYFCVMTMSTIGFGDYAPSSDLSKIFTMIYSLVSIGMFAVLVSKIVSHILAIRRGSRIFHLGEHIRSKHHSRSPGGESGDRDEVEN